MKSFFAYMLCFLLCGPVYAQNHTVTLQWNPTNGTLTNVRRGTQGAGSETMLQPNVSGNSYVDAAVVENQTYFYTVRAINTTGFESVDSNEVTAFIAPVTPPPPQNNCSTTSKNTCTLKTTPTSLPFTLSGGSATSLTIKIDDNSPSGSGTIPVCLTVDKPWMQVAAPNCGRTGGTFTIQASAAGVSASDTGNVIVTATGPNPGGYSVNNSPLKVPVTLTIPGGTTPPLTSRSITCTGTVPSTGAFTLSCN